MCKICLSSSSKKTIKEEAKQILSEKNENEVSSGNSALKIRGLHSLSVPGIPPEDLEEHEVDYYNKRWSDYQGYYRNPAAYYNCHQLILLEIHSSYLNKQLIVSRGELQKELSRNLQVTITLRKTVQDQLPDKEAEDIMDDEKSLAMIYENYKKEKQLRSLGPVSRVFRKDTVAIAPYITFPLDPKQLLLNCGFKVVDVEKVLEKIKEIPKEDRTPEEILKFFGFELEEKYAMQTGLTTEDELEIESMFGDETE